MAWADTGQIYFKFQIQSHDEVYQFTESISIDNVKDLTVYAYATDQQFARFKTLGYSYEILPSPGSLISPRMSGTIEGVITDWDTYPTYQAYLDMMNQFATDYPSLCTIVNIGTTVQGRQLLFAKLSTNVNIETTKPEVMYSSSMHGDETTGYVLMLHLISYLLTNYGTDPQVTRLLDSTEVWINPLANPDGTYHGGNNSVNGSWRYNANSVDLNRNFPDPAAGNHPDGNSWQPETIAMMNFFAAHRFVISANFHGGAEVVNYPWDTWSRLHADNTWFINVSRAYADSVHAHAPSGYMTDLNNGITNGYAWYRVTGGRQDYETYFKGGREETIELSSTKLLPANQLPAHWDYNRISLLNYLENALYGIRGVVTDSVSGAPLPATITVLSHDIDSARVFTDPDIGDYHRMLAAGTYNLSITSPGYITQTVNNISVTNRHATEVDIRLQAANGMPNLSYQSNDAGESAAGDTISMHITLKNDGGFTAQNAIGVLSSSDSYATITQGTSGYPTIAPSGMGVSLAAYGVAISPSCPAYHQINFRLGLTANGGYIDSAFFSIIVGRQFEDFETANFERYPWQMGGYAPWVISSIAPYEGVYCAKSGAIPDSQASELLLPINVSTSGTISFYYKVSSEATYDYLRFYVDSNLQGQWSGEVGWTQASYNISAGAHTLKWGYYKDRNTVHGSDCGWIDFIIFPPLSPTISIITDSLPDWTAGHFYSQQLVAEGGSGALVWNDLSGGLNGTGLALSPNGLISGEPNGSRQITFTSLVQDQSGGSAQREFSFFINPILSITTDSLPDGAVNVFYTQQLQSIGGTGLVIWSDRDNNLSGTGLTLSQGGLLNGTPSVSGNLDFVARAVNAIGDSADHPFQIAVIGRGSYVPGDVNSTGQANGVDVVYLVAYFKGGSAPPLSIDCPPNGSIFPTCDANGSCSVNGLDVTYLVSFFKGGPVLHFCPDCPPEGRFLKSQASAKKVD
jgi:hypothetical protein